MHSNIALNTLNTANHVLLLQGPVGPFFKQLQLQLLSVGKRCTKLNLNGGDEFYSNKDAATLSYTQPPNQFEAFLLDLIQSTDIDTLVCFGDCRFYHRIAKQVATQLNINFLVFEEGYIRPVYITFEQDGVNDYSHLNYMPCPALTESQIAAKALSESNSTEAVSSKIKNITWYALCYYFMLFIKQNKFKHFLHHRDKTPFEELLCGLRSIMRAAFNRHRDRRVFNRLLTRHTQFFLVALQVYNDSQIRCHSDYPSIEAFIEEVIISFAQHANDTDVLLFKHHPLDRGYRNYTDTIDKLGRKYAVNHRLFYVCDICLPTAIKAARGLVTINSTTGLQAMYHGTPVICTGRAIYKRDNLVSGNTLDDFWQSPKAADPASYKSFRYFLIERSLYNGSFYGKSPWLKLIKHTPKALNIDK